MGSQDKGCPECYHTAAQNIVRRFFRRRNVDGFSCFGRKRDLASHGWQKRRSGLKTQNAYSRNPPMFVVCSDMVPSCDYESTFPETDGQNSTMDDGHRERERERLI